MARWPYNTERWQRLRKAKLADHPLCEGCKPKLTPASHVDHRQAINDGGDPWAWDNLSSLCASCHNRKTARMDGAFGNRRRKGYGCDEHGRPLDPDHWWNVKE